MAKGYAIFTELINDTDAIDAYARKALPTLLAAGGTPIVVGPPAEVTEGEWHGTQTVIIEFESVEAAQAWYHSADYQAIIGMRHDAADSNAAILTGFEMPTG